MGSRQPRQHPLGRDRLDPNRSHGAAPRPQRGNARDTIPGMPSPARPDALQDPESSTGGSKNWGGQHGNRDEMEAKQSKGKERQPPLRMQNPNRPVTDYASYWDAANRRELVQLANLKRMPNMQDPQMQKNIEYHQNILRGMRGGVPQAAEQGGGGGNRSGSSHGSSNASKTLRGNRVSAKDFAQGSQGRDAGAGRGGSRDPSYHGTISRN